MGEPHTAIAIVKRYAVICIWLGLLLTESNEGTAELMQKSICWATPIYNLIAAVNFHSDPGAPFGRERS